MGIESEAHDVAPFFVHQCGTKRSAHGACCLSPRHHQAVNCKLDAKLRAIADAGVDAFEIFENDLLSAPQTSREIGVIMTDLGRMHPASPRSRAIAAGM